MRRLIRWIGRPFQRLRLRHKLAVSLSIAALLPVLVASWMAVSLVLDGLDKGLREETDRQLHVGLNLALRHVERLGADAVRLSSAGDLSRAMASGDRVADVDDFLSREAAHLPAALVQITDENGEHVARRTVGGVESRFAGLEVNHASPSVLAGMAYERRVTIIPIGDVLVVRAVAPIADSSYELQGVVVLSVPLDGGFTDEIKGALDADVLIFSGVGESVSSAMSTFLDKETGARESQIDVSREVASRVAAGETVLHRDNILGREYAVGYTPLVNLQGEVVGIFAVAVDRAPLRSAKTASTRSLALGAAGAFVFALGLAGLLSRRLTRPIAHLHRGAIAIARGDLNHEITVAEGDEIGDLARAFAHMTKALKENQERLAARMREIVALHDAGRAVSAVINHEQVLRKIVDSVARVFEVRLCALWVVQPADDVEDTGARDAARRGRLRLGAARAKRSGMRATLRLDEAAVLAEPLSSIAADIASARATLRVDRVADDERFREASIAAGVTGSLLGTPLERKGAVVGVLIVGRPRDARPFSEADSNLLATFADQAASAVENARLYEEVRAFNEELEAKVKLRTAELTHMNAELGKALNELRETQSQLILSERLAGLGMLVAGVAHEVNSPSAAIRGSVDALDDNVRRLTELFERLNQLPVSPGSRVRLLSIAADNGPALAKTPMASAVRVRRQSRALRTRFEDLGVEPDTASRTARSLVEAGASAELVDEVVSLIEDQGQQGATEAANVFIGYLAEYVFLHRNAHTIRNAIRRIQRVVGSLKTYSRVDQEAGIMAGDVHAGIDDTLVLLDHVLRDITVSREYGDLPPVPIYVDELNQVWTNLLQNAVQAVEGRGHITIETAAVEDGVAVRIIDDGPGIPADVQPRIFEPFFTTKGKGEGTGLGLGIVSQIINKHNGRVTCQSEPGRTCFEVWLPIVQPEVAADDSARIEVEEASA